MRKNSQGSIAIFEIRGMSDKGEARQVRRTLGRLVGVSGVEMNYITDVVSVRYDGKKLSLDTIRDAIARARSG